MPDRHSTSWANPCWICGRVNSHDHTTAEWTAAEWAVTAALDALAAQVEGMHVNEAFGGVDIPDVLALIAEARR